MDEVNQYRRTVLAVPLSSSAKENPPLTVKIRCQGKTGIAIVDQLRAISKERLRSFIEEADPAEIERVTEALATIVEA